MSKRLLAISMTASAALLALCACAQVDDPPSTAGAADDPAPRAALSDAALVEDGREIARLNCASCHAIGTEGASPNPRAPVFRTVLSRYKTKTLANELIGGMTVAHAPMPRFQFNPAGTDSLIAYLESIQVREPGSVALRATGARSAIQLGKRASAYLGAQRFRNLGARWTPIRAYGFESQPTKLSQRPISSSRADGRLIGGHG